MKQQRFLPHVAWWIAGFVCLFGCRKSQMEQEKIRVQLAEVTQERDRLLQQQKEDHAKWENTLVDATKTRTQLQQCEALLSTPDAGKERQRKAFLKQACADVAKPEDASAKAESNGDSIEKWSKLEQEVLQRRKEFDVALVGTADAQKAWEKAEKASDKQKRALNKEERLLLQQSPGSTQYAKAQKAYDQASGKYSELSSSQIEAVKQLGKARENELQARTRFLAAVDRLLEMGRGNKNPANPPVR